MVMVISQLSMVMNGYQGLLMVSNGYWLSISYQWLLMVSNGYQSVINGYQ